MSEMSELYKVPAPEEIDSLLLGDFGVDEAAPQSSSTLEAGDRKSPEELIAVLKDIGKVYFCADVTTELAEEMLDDIQAMGWQLVKFTGNAIESSSTLEETEKFIRPIILKAWLPGAVYIDLYDDGWEVRQHPDPLDEDVSKSDWIKEKSEELDDLLRLKHELTCCLKNIQKYAEQIDIASKAQRDGGLSGWEHRGVQLLIKYLAGEILSEVRNHLKVTVEVVNHDLHF